MRRHPKAPPRQWFDYLPILGWWGLQREEPIYGRFYWLRPMAIEIGLGFSFAALYQWEILGGQYPSFLGEQERLTLANSQLFALHVRYLAHLILITLMAIATFIDFDERIIPDQVTVTGALLALLLATVAPDVRLPIFPTVYNGVESSSPQVTYALLHAASPQTWPAWLQTRSGLGCGLACFWGWCFAIWPKIWDTRFGYLKALQFMWASMIGAPRKHQRADLPPRRHALWLMLAIGIVGGAGVAAGWAWGGEHWLSLMSALVGLAFGGGMIWAVRIVGKAALRQEAMGFGDVTLMAMIGAFLGWQTALLVFFCAPFTSLVIAVAQKIFSGESHIAFGPYLCAAALILLLWWGDLWNGWADDIFGLGWYIPQLLLVLLVLMGGMLMGLRLMRERGEPA
ncbi:prepilin peptidase [Lignipirellula cremea]|nr:A24 family peptidase [Lignipirellula cremea]